MGRGVNVIAPAAIGPVATLAPSAYLNCRWKGRRVGAGLAGSRLGSRCVPQNFLYPQRDQPFLMPVDMRDWLPEDDVVVVVLDAVRSWSATSWISLSRLTTTWWTVRPPPDSPPGFGSFWKAPP